MDRHDWSRLNHLQLGRYAEYFVKMEFTLFGFDVYGAEVDDRGIDFVARSDAGKYWDVQVKSCRDLNYLYFRKDRFTLRSNLLAAVVLFSNDEAPDVYLIPATAWDEPNALFVSRDYAGMASAPEWGLNLSARNLKYLKPYGFSATLSRLAGVA